MTDTQPLALITGASSGIGLELAHQFAAGGHDLLLVAEDDALTAAAEQVRARTPGAEVTTLQTDLRRGEAVEQVVAAGRTPDALALNAGVGEGGAFVDQDVADVLSIVDLNVRSTTLLAHALLPAMVRRGSGRVLITSSIASTMPGPFQAVYNASKSFLQSFAKALQGELAGTGVTVTSLLPGPTDTKFFLRGDLLDTLLGKGPKDDPADVARQGYEALMSGRSQVVAASLMTKVMAASNAVLPDQVKVAAHRVMARPRS